MMPDTWPGATVALAVIALLAWFLYIMVTK